MRLIAGWSKDKWAVKLRMIGLTTIGAGLALGLVGCALFSSSTPDEKLVLRVRLDDRGQVRAQMAEVIETIRVRELHEKGLKGQGQRIFLIAPFSKVRSGFGIPPGMYLEEIIKTITPEADVVPCETGGDFFYVSPEQVVDCLLEAQSQPERPTVTVVGVMVRTWLEPNQVQTEEASVEHVGCPAWLMETWESAGIGPIFAGAGDFGEEGVAFPACLPGVTPVVATYDATVTEELPLLVNCRPGVIHKDELACFSNFLRGKSLLAAPGAVVHVDVLADLEVKYCCSTAVAATVAGAVTALLQQAFPQALWPQIFQAYKETGVPIYRSDTLSGEREFVGIRLSAHRAFLWLEERMAMRPETGLPPVQTPSSEVPASARSPSVRDFDENQDCQIDELELAKAAQALQNEEISVELFLQVVRAWVEQANVCTLME